MYYSWRRETYSSCASCFKIINCKASFPSQQMQTIRADVSALQKSTTLHQFDSRRPKVWLLGCLHSSGSRTPVHTLCSYSWILALFMYHESCSIMYICLCSLLVFSANLNFPSLYLTCRWVTSSLVIIKVSYKVKKFLCDHLCFSACLESSDNFNCYGQYINEIK